MTRLATIDIGSNTLLLLVADDASGTLVPVADECRFGRLGQGLAESQSLHPDAIARSLEILRDYRKILDQHAVQRVAAVATQAIREVDNAEMFLGPAREILGADIEVISGEREAALVLRAVSESFPDLRSRPLITADVGGGSTEIILSDGDDIRWLRSVPIGAVRLSERHLHSDPPTKAEVMALFADIDARLAELDIPTGVPVVGTAGTATSIASIELKLFDYDAARVHGLRLTRATVAKTLARLLELTNAERRNLRGLEPQRADVIAAGLAIYSRLLERASAETFVVSDRGVRWGLAYELAEK